MKNSFVLTLKTLIIMWIFSSFYCVIASSQTENEPVARFETGAIYLQLRETSGIELSMPRSVNSPDSLDEIYQIFNNYDVKEIELPFKALPSSKFDYAYRIQFKAGSVAGIISDLEELSYVQPKSCNSILLI